MRGAARKHDCALALAAGRRPLETVCEVLGVARSGVVVKWIRPSDWQDSRSARVTDNTELVEEIQAYITHLPSYGYRRIWALLRHTHELVGAPRINHKRAYRVMRELPSAQRRGSGHFLSQIFNSTLCTHRSNFLVILRPQ